jgi:hypothetical protein
MVDNGYGMAVAGLGIMRFDDSFETSPGSAVHPAQELLLASLAALVAELAVGECELLIHGSFLDAVEDRYCLMS